MKDIIIPLSEIIDEASVERKLRRVGSKGLSLEGARELGLIERVSYLLCSMHSLVSVAYRIYGEVDMWFSKAGVKRHEIKVACSRFEKACDEWFKFWSEYQTDAGAMEMVSDIDDLFRQFMRWANLPAYWDLGDAQRTESDPDFLIDVPFGEKVLRLGRDVVEHENISDVKEEWYVLRLEKRGEQKVMHRLGDAMDKASAQMSAKRMSANDSDNFYTVGLFQTVEERRVEVVPYKVFKCGEAVGSIKKVCV